MVDKLLSKGANVVVFDTQWFGNYLPKNKNLEVIKDDIKNLSNYSLNDCNKFVHLANIANDPGVELNPSLSWEVNVLASYQIMEQINKSSIDQVMYQLRQCLWGQRGGKCYRGFSLVPISVYNKTK